MKITVTGRVLLVSRNQPFVLAEEHGLVHTGLGRLLCSSWSPRSFNGWSLYNACATKQSYTNLAAMLAGPVFTFAVGWAGYFLLDPHNSIPRWSLGFALVFATVPFPRIFGEVVMDSNDEVHALSEFLTHHGAGALGAALVLQATVPPLVRACAALAPQGQVGAFVTFLLPFPFIVAVLLMDLNPLMISGLLATYSILSSPLLITCQTVAVGAMLALTYRHLLALGQPVSTTAPRPQRAIFTP